MYAKLSGKLKKTPLYEHHVLLQGTIVDFGGWALPIYYTGIIAEHQWTRQSCSFFDVSHLGEIRVTGPKAFEFLQHRLTNDLKKCEPWRMQYTLLCDERGCALDDILVYRGVIEDYYLIVNAANISRDLAELKKYVVSDVILEDKSQEMGCVAVQGPKSEVILEKIFGFRLQSMPYYSFKEEKFCGETVWVSRSGYTGEDGFEIFSLNELVPRIWDRLMTEGKKQGALPAGLGARNTLRLEAGNVLYGHELDDTTTPLEARLNFVLSWDKGDFVGRESLLNQKQTGVQKKLVGFKMLDKSVARENYPILKEGKKIGAVTSGSYAPSVGGNIGMAYVATGHENLGNTLAIEIHGKLAKAEIVRRPFIPLSHKK